MLELLAEVTKGTRRLASTFNPELLTVRQLNRIVDDTSSAMGMLETIKAKAAARLAESKVWKRDGFRSPADALAQQTGCSLSRAQDSIETGRRLAGQPEVSDAALGGEISFEQASLIADATEADPLSARRLIRKAQRSPLAELRDEVARTKAAACPDLETRRKKIHASRSLHDWVDAGGTWHLKANGNPEDGAQVMAAIAQLSDEIFLRADSEERAAPKTTRDFDALVVVAKRFSSGGRKRATFAADPRGPSGDRAGRCGAPVKLLVRIDYEAFLRGVPRRGETCEIAGYGPVSVGTVRDMIDKGDPFVAAILTKGQALAGVAHLGRKPTACQRTALEWLYPTCAVGGCRASAHLECDHVLDWSKTRFTMLDHLDFKCTHHHRLKTTADWDFVVGTREFVPPEDPRHPRHRKRRE